MLVSLFVSIFLKLSFLASLSQLPFDSIKSCLSLLIALVAKLIFFFLLTKRKLLLTIGFVVVNNLHDGEHIWRRSRVAGGNKLFETLNIIPIRMSAEHCEVDDQKSGCSTASCRTTHKYFMTLLINQSVQNFGSFE